METLYIIQKTARTCRRIKLVPALLAFITISCFFNPALAQRKNSNFSDWNVPPPLPPGNVTKGATTGKITKNKPAVLTLTDVPTIPLPVVPPVKVPGLAPVSSVLPLVNPPGQPATKDGGPTDIPLPGAPDAPPLPQQSYQDEQFSAVDDLPVPESPEMPVLPHEPTPSGQSAAEKRSIPLMPDVVSLPPPSLQGGNSLSIWSSPGIPENTGFELKAPAVKKGAKYSRKGTQKVKSDHLKDKTGRLKQKPK